MKWRAMDLLQELREKIEAANPNVKFFKVKNGYDYKDMQLRVFELPAVK